MSEQVYIDTATPARSSAEATDPKAHDRVLRHGVWAQYEQVAALMRDAGLDTSGSSPLFGMLSAGHAHAEFWERRANRLERALRELLASDLVSDEQRAEVVAIVHGRKKVGRDMRTLTDAELDVITRYRALASPDKQVARGIIVRLGAHQNDGGTHG